MTNFTRFSQLVGAAALLLLLSASPAEAQTAPAPAPCVLGYTVGFFSGVGTTEMDAISGREAIADATREATGSSDDTYNNEDIGYQLFYNHTGSTVGSSVLQDVAEVFIQRANQLDATGYFAQNDFYLFWESVTNHPVYSIAAGPVVGISALLDNFRNAVVAHAVASLSAAIDAFEDVLEIDLGVEAVESG